MDLLDRYLFDIGRRLPRKNREKDLAELRSQLETKLKERGDGEPSEQDILTLLEETGAPEKVAARYFPEGQYLIGPMLYPSFRSSIGIALLVLVIVHLVLLGVFILFTNQPDKALNLLGSFYNTAMMIFGTIVLVFAILQWVGFRPKETKQKWDPRTLPEITGHEPIKRGELIAGIVFSVIFLSILLVFQNGIPIIQTPGSEATLIFLPVINQFLPLIGFGLLISIAADSYLLWRGEWNLWTRTVKILSDLLGLAILAVLLTNQQAWLTQYTGGSFLGYLTYLPSVEEFTAETIQVMVTQAIQIGLFVAFIVTIIEVVTQAYKLIRKAS